MSVNKRARTQGAVSEMDIVDTFTKLIFGGETHYTRLEADIIQGLRTTEPCLTLNSHYDMGAYLRALGVAEMVKLVSEVRLEMSLGHTLPQGPVGLGARSARPRAI